MDPDRFDRFTRLLAASGNRRQLFKAALAAIPTGIISLKSGIGTARASGIPALYLPFAADAGVEIVQGWYYNFTPASCDHCCDPNNLRLHCGIDYFNGSDPNDSSTWQTFPVRASAAGEACGNCVSRAGNAVWITHTVNGQTFHTYYGHLASIDPAIPQGQKTVHVEAGQVVGMAGDSGAPKGLIHLHFQVNAPDGTKIDPYGIYSTAKDYPNPAGTNGKHVGADSYWATDPPTFASSQPVSSCPPQMQFCSSQSICVKACPKGQALNQQDCTCGCTQPCPGNQKQAKDCTCSCQGNAKVCQGSDQCVDLKTDPTNCGTCGHSCNGGTCQGGKCRCSGPLSTCGDTCADVLTDSNNCGTCGNVCKAGTTCQNGQCLCPGGHTLCNGACVDTSSDGANCGGCGNPTTGEHICSQVDGEICCAGACVDSLTDPQHCGNCTTDCPDDQVCDQGKGCCPKGFAVCNDTCVRVASFQSDPKNCGACGHECGSGICLNGQCASACPDGQAFCGSNCIDTTSDPKNCGKCGNICGDGETCQAGACRSPTTGSLRIRAVDGAGNPVPGGWFDYPSSDPAAEYSLIDGTVAVPGWADADGVADGTVVFHSIPAGDHGFRLDGVVDPNSSYQPLPGLPISHTYVDTISSHWLHITAGETADLTITLVGPSARVDVDWLDSCGNPIANDLAQSERLSMCVYAAGETWFGFPGPDGCGGGPGERLTASGTVKAPVGAGQVVVAVYQQDRYGQYHVLQSQLADTALGQTTQVAVTVLGVGICPGTTPATPNASLKIASAPASTPTVCAERQTACNNSCVDTTSDPMNCGSCGVSCESGSCTNGHCDEVKPTIPATEAPACPGGQTLCASECADTLADAANCGTCGNQCEEAETCTQGGCVPLAPIGTPIT